MATDRSDAIYACAEAFAKGDYKGCIERARPLLALESTHQLLQLTIISLLRLGQNETASQLGSQALAVTQHFPWENMLLRLTLGLTCGDNILAQAGDETQRCQALYYSAVVAQRVGRTEDADRLLAEASRARVTCLERDLAAIEAASPEQRTATETISRLQECALQLYHPGTYQQALEFATDAYELAVQHLAEVHQAFLGSLHLLARLCEVTTATARAEELFRKEGEILLRSHGDSDSLYATSLSCLARVLAAKGETAEAEQLWCKSVEIQSVVLGSNHPDTCQTLGELAEAYRSWGRLAESESCYRRVVESRAPSSGEEGLDLADALTRLAVVCGQRNSLAESESLHKRALLIRQKAVGESDPLYAESLYNLAILYQHMNTPDRAVPLLHHAVKIVRTALGEHHPALAAMLHGLGKAHRAQGDDVIAEGRFRQAVAIRQAALGEGDDDTIESMRCLAGVYKARGDFGSAVPLMRKVLDSYQQSLGKDHPYVRTNTLHLALMYTALGQVTEALRSLRPIMDYEGRELAEGFAFASEQERMDQLGRAEGRLHFFLTFVSLHLPDTATAAAEGLNLLLRRKGLASEALAIQRNAILGGRYPHLKHQLEELTRIRERIARKSLEGPTEGWAAHRETLRRWGMDRERLEQQLSKHIPETKLELLLRSVDVAAVARALPESSALVEFVRFDVFDFQSLATRARRGERLYREWGEFDLFDLDASPRAHRDQTRWKPARYLAFVLLSGEPVRVNLIDLGEAEPLEHLTAEFWTAIARDGTDRTGRNQGRVVSPEQRGVTLRTAVFDAVVPSLDGRKRLFLAPDGELYRLPFHLLPQTDGCRLLDVYQISYVNTGRDVMRWSAAFTGQPSPPQVVADPDFALSLDGLPTQSADRAPTRLSRDLHRTYHFARLPATGREGEHIAAMLGVQPWLQKAALEGRLKQACRSPRILHLATHGFFLEDQKRGPNREHTDINVLAATEPGPGRLSGTLPENPLLRAGLALAGAQTWLEGGQLPSEAEDGLLTAEDVSGLDLLSTELVVLSACETALGDVHAGEGVFGLQRAFMLAGAKTLVMSLWCVPDEHTRELMEDFYRRILAGQPRADALLDAQRVMKAKYPDPYYWGAFICQGDPGPLRNQ